MSSRASPILIILTAILLFSILTPRVLADDNSPTHLTITTNTTATSATTTAITNTLTTISKNVNDTTFNNYKAQVGKDCSTGNNLACQQAVQNIKDYIGTPNGSKLPAPVQDYVKSLTTNPNGLGFDPSLFKTLMGLFGPDGLPVNWPGINPNLAANDLFAMSNLMNLLGDPSSADFFRQGFEQLRNFGGIKPPNLNIHWNLPGGPGAPSLPGVRASLPGAPALPGLSQLILPIIITAIAGIAVFLLLYRKRLGVLGGRVTPMTFKPKTKLIPELGLNLQSPRDLIIYYFRKVVGSMTKRGVPRLDPETHREFSDKCKPRPEAPPVQNISVLYEKAMFSGRQVSQPDAEEARGCSVQVEQTPTTAPKKDGRGKLWFRARTTKIG